MAIKTLDKINIEQAFGYGSYPIYDARTDTAYAPPQIELDSTKELVENFGTTINEVSVVILNLDEECRYDLSQRRGIRISNVEAFDKKRKNEKNWDGLQSEFFGTDFSEDAAFQERWSCKCHKYTGMAYRGVFCENCKSFVDYHDIDLTKFGWIIIDRFRVINPIIAAKLGKALGRFEGESVLGKILTMKYRDEGEDAELTEKEMLMQKKHPFVKKGMLWLYDHLEEVIDYYDKKKPTQHAVFEDIRRELAAGTVWTHSIPVFSALLRTELPAEKDHKLFKLRSNTTYQAIIRLSNAINAVAEDELEEFTTLNAIDIKLCAIQRKLETIFETTVADLTGKPGIIISKVCGGRYNFSTRDIIIPSSGKLRSDQIELGYIPFLELFRYEIINFYSKLTGCTIMEASNAHKKATNHFDPTIYSIMDYMVTNPTCRKYCNVLLGRNPYINYGSVIFVTVVHVKKDLADKTITLPSHDIVAMNADFDGDVLAAFRIFGEDLAKRFGKNLNPRYNMLISRMDGLVNKDMLPVKDENVAFWAFNTL